MHDIQAIIERVRKLLALSQSDNANEAAVATAKANQLIDEYRISVEQLGQADDPMILDQSEPLYQADRAMAWRKTLAVKLSRHYGCYVWNNQTTRNIFLCVAGRRSDIAVLRYMFAYISSECERLSVKACKGKGRTYAESYRIGFVDGVTTKLAESRATVAAANGETALVKLDDRARAAREAVTSAVRLTKGRSTARGPSDASAFSSGQIAGRSLHLGASIGAGAMRLLGS